MKLSIHTDRLERRMGALAAVRMIAEAGFEAIDYSMYYTDLAVFGRGGGILAVEIRKVASSLGLTVNQAHAPFSDFFLAQEYTEKYKSLYYSICRSFSIAAKLGAKTVVVHPAFFCPYISADERFEMTMELFSKLVPAAQSEGVGIAIENIYRRHSEENRKIVKSACSDAAELIRYADALSDLGVSVCFDVGHANLFGENAATVIRNLGSRISLIHIHDNDSKDDQHTLPYLLNADFSAVCKALAKIGYNGDITLESDGFFKNMPDSLLPSALLFSRSVAAHIRDEITKLSS